MNGTQPRTFPTTMPPPLTTPAGPPVTAPTNAQQSLTLLAGIKVELEELNGRMDVLMQMLTIAREASQSEAKVLADLLSALVANMTDFLNKLPTALATTHTPATAAQPAADETGGSVFQTIDCTSIVKTMDERGNWKVSVKGGQYQQFGIPIYSEYFARFGLDPDALPPGTSRWDHRIRVEMRTNTAGKLVPARAVGFAANDA